MTQQQDEKRLPIYQKDERVHDSVRRALQRLPDFQSLPSQLLDEIVAAFERERGLHTAVRSGDKISKFYVICSGQAEVYSTAATKMLGCEQDELLIAQLGEGDSFNSTALLLNKKPADMRTEWKVVCHMADLYSLRRDTFMQLQDREVAFFRTMEAREFLHSLPMIKELEPAAAEHGGSSLSCFGSSSSGDNSGGGLDIAISNLLLRLAEHTVTTVEDLLAFFLTTPLVASSTYHSTQQQHSAERERRIATARRWALVKAGTLKITMRLRRQDANTHLLDRSIAFNRGDVLDADALRGAQKNLERGVMSCTLPQGSITVMYYEPQKINAPLPQSLLSDKLEQLLDVQYARKLLQTIAAFSGIATQTLDELLSRVRKQTFAAEEQILIEGEINARKSSMYVVIHGAARATRKNAEGVPELLGYFDVGEQFGAQALYDHAAGERKPRTVTVTAHTKLTCLAFSAAALGGLLKQVLTSLAREAENRNWQLAHWGSVAFQDLYQGPILGVGNFGHVWLALHKPTGSTFAVRTIPKKRLVSKLSREQVSAERYLMASCHHPFICKLVGSFQCPLAVYFVLELVEGGELWDILCEEGGTFATRDCLFYTANTVAAVSHLHSLHIVHRDVKLENLIISSDGYLKLIDFGFAKHLPDGTRTATLCGTPHYMAPEQVRYETHGQPVDLWAIGCLLYEMLFGRSPFEPTVFHTGTPLDIWQRLVRFAEGERSLLSIPFCWLWSSPKQHFAIADLLKGLLEPDISRRTTVGEAAEHEAMQDFKLLEIEQRSIEAPYVPTPSSAAASPRDHFPFARSAERAPASAQPISHSFIAPKRPKELSPSKSFMKSFTRGSSPTFSHSSPSFIQRSRSFLRRKAAHIRRHRRSPSPPSPVLHESSSALASSPSPTRVGSPSWMRRHSFSFGDRSRDSSPSPDRPRNRRSSFNNRRSSFSRFRISGLQDSGSLTQYGATLGRRKSFMRPFMASSSPAMKDTGAPVLSQKSGRQQRQITNKQLVLSLAKQPAAAEPAGVRRLSLQDAMLPTVAHKGEANGEALNGTVDGERESNSNPFPGFEKCDGWGERGLTRSPRDGDSERDTPRNGTGARVPRRSSASLESGALLALANRFGEASSPSGGWQRNPSPSGGWQRNPSLIAADGARSPSLIPGNGVSPIILSNSSPHARSASSRRQRKPSLTTARTPTPDDSFKKGGSPSESTGRRFH